MGPAWEVASGGLAPAAECSSSPRGGRYGGSGLRLYLPAGASPRACSTSVSPNTTLGFHMWPGDAIRHKLAAQGRVFRDAGHFIILITSSRPEIEMRCSSFLLSYHFPASNFFLDLHFKEGIKTDMSGFPKILPLPGHTASRAVSPTGSRAC